MIVNKLCFWVFFWTNKVFIFVQIDNDFSMSENNQAFLYKCDGEIVPVLPKNGISFTLKELSNFVKGYIQIISLRDGRLMVLNEDGKMDNLKVNDTATVLAKETLFPDDYIVGDVLVTPFSFVN